jgi:uncharacterized protein (TIGR01777 family)
MKVLITGATGFVGRALVPRLFREGHLVTAWARDPDSAESILGKKVSVAAASGGPDAMLTAVSWADVVINLAGESVAGGRWTERRKAALVASRIDTTRLIVDAIERSSNRPRVLISASAVGVYGDSGDADDDEQTAPASDFLASLCVAWEAAAKRAEGLGVRVVLARIGVVIGPEGGALQKLLPLFRAGLGGRIAGGQQWMSWIHRDDLVSSLVFAMGCDALSGPFNAVVPAPARNADFTRALAAAVKRPAFMAVPAFALRAVMGEAAIIAVGGQKVLPRALLNFGFSFKYGNLGDALSAVVGSASSAVVTSVNRSES